VSGVGKVSWKDRGIFRDGRRNGLEMSLGHEIGNNGSIGMMVAVVVVIAGSGHVVIVSYLYSS